MKGLKEKICTNCSYVDEDNYCHFVEKFVDDNDTCECFENKEEEEHGTE